MKKIIAIVLFVLCFAAPSLGAGHDQGERVLPLELINSLVVVDGQINGHPTRMVIDTGATETLIDSSFVKRLGLKPIDDHNIYFPGQTVRGKVVNVGFQIGTDQFTQSVVAIDLKRRSADEGIGIKVDMVVGNSVLCKLSFFQIDYDKRTFTYSLGPAARGCQKDLPIIKAHLPAREKPAVLLVDTGFLGGGLVLFGAETDYGLPAGLVNGGSDNSATLVRLPEIRFGKMILKNRDAYLTPHMANTAGTGMDGVIGALGSLGFKFLRVDNLNSTLELRFQD